MTKSYIKILVESGSAIESAFSLARPARDRHAHDFFRSRAHELVSGRLHRGSCRINVIHDEDGFPFHIHRPRDVKNAFDILKTFLTG